MKLFFPNGEHPQVLIARGSQQVGQGSDLAVVLSAPGVAERHAELVRDGDLVSLRALEPGVALQVNGKPVPDESSVSLNPGDLIEFGSVMARVVGVEKAGTVPAPRLAPVDDSGATRVRMALPRFVLRGVSGAAFGKVYPVMTQQVIGRQADCDIVVPSEEISRRHAQVRPTPDGLHIEDLGSSNGTFINGKRLQEGVLRPGEELRLDNIRFILVAPGAEIPAVSRLAKGGEPQPTKGSSMVAWFVASAVLIGAAGAAAYYFFG